MESEDRERTTMDTEMGPADDPAVGDAERQAAAEAGNIGGPVSDAEGDEANRPVVEAGGGVAEGFEESERALAEQASHGEQAGSPEADRFSPEPEGDRASAVYGEADEVDATEVTRDPREPDDDPGQGPGLAPDR